MNAPTLPTPGECHPDFRKNTWLRTWIQDMTSRDDHVRVAELCKVTLDEPVELTIRVLTRRKAYGMAPYVGRPFVYTWHCATDDIGRTIASEAVIAYTDRPWQANTPGQPGDGCRDTRPTHQHRCLSCGIAQVFTSEVCTQLAFVPPCPHCGHAGWTDDVGA